MHKHRKMLLLQAQVTLLPNAPPMWPESQSPSQSQVLDLVEASNYQSPLCTLAGVATTSSRIHVASYGVWSILPRSSKYKMRTQPCGRCRCNFNEQASLYWIVFVLLPSMLGCPPSLPLTIRSLNMSPVASSGQNFSDIFCLTEY